MNFCLGLQIGTASNSVVMIETTDLGNSLVVSEGYRDKNDFKSICDLESNVNKNKQE